MTSQEDLLVSQFFGVVFERLLVEHTVKTPSALVTTAYHTPPAAECRHGIYETTMPWGVQMTRPTAAGGAVPAERTKGDWTVGTRERREIPEFRLPKRSCFFARYGKVCKDYILAFRGVRHTANFGQIYFRRGPGRMRARATGARPFCFRGSQLFT